MRNIELLKMTNFVVMKSGNGQNELETILEGMVETADSRSVLRLNFLHFSELIKLC